MPENDLLYLSANETLELYRSRKLSPVELMDAVIQNAASNDHLINALTYCYFDEAMEQAKTAEMRYAGKGGPPRALEGIPVAIKDSGHIAGKPTSAGSLTTGDNPQNTTSRVNQRVLNDGAIVHARTATPEFSCATFTHSKRWGISRNPWNTDFTPGGSSGGAGASLAAGFAPLATGSDIGGSIRIPASCCGVVGYKPPYGRNPVDAPFNFDHYCHTGPMARCVHDIILMQNSMCGPSSRDATLLSPKLELAFQYPSLDGMRIAWSMDFGFYEVDPSVVKNTLEALMILESAGAHIEEVKIPWTWDHVEAGLTHLRHVFGSSIAAHLDDDADLMTTYCREFAEAGRASNSERYFESLVKTGEASQCLYDAISGFDVFICPTTAVPAVPADYDHTQRSLLINGTSVEPMLGWTMTLPFNMLSGHPVISLPSGYSPLGIPTGIQIVGQPYQDEAVFQVALEYEQLAKAWFITKENHPILSSLQVSPNERPIDRHIA